MHEIYSMTRNEENESWLVILIDWLGGIGMFTSIYLMCTGDPSIHGLALTPIAAYIVARCIIQLYRPKQHAMHSLERSLFSLTYIALPIAMLNSIIEMSSARTLLAIFCFIWINDTGAFLAGVTLGRHKMFPRISPKKSWEGLIGGIVLCIVAAFASHYWCNDFFMAPQIGTWIGLSIVVSLAATFGDLTESLLKRTMGVKDSGKLIPGHGGILDRIDSLLLVAPATLIYLALVIYNNL